MKGTGPHPYCFRSFSPSVLAALASIEMMPFALIETYLPAVDLLRIFPSDEYRFRAGSRMGPNCPSATPRSEHLASTWQISPCCRVSHWHRQHDGLGECQEKENSAHSGFYSQRCSRLQQLGKSLNASLFTGAYDLHPKVPWG